MNNQNSQSVADDVQSSVASSAFAQFTNQYSLSKTLRFELRPVGKTRENIEKANPKFIHDQEIEDAYQVLKPVFDKLHEDFITNSLKGDEAKKISFVEYFDLYKMWNELKKKKSSEQNKKKKKEIEKEIDKIYKEGKTKGKIQKLEDNLRKKFEVPFEEYGKVFKQKASEVKESDEDTNDDEDRDEEKDEKKKGFRKLLKAKFLLDYIAKYLETDEIFNGIKSTEGKEITKEQIEKAFIKFKVFSTYFRGFDLNRLNYYTTKEEKATAVASRVVGENLPKFCDNILDFEKRKIEYEKALKFLEDNNIATIDKDQNPLYAITSFIFEIEHFNACMSQAGIEAYNKKIGNANFVINLYNQQQTDKSKKLRFFKTLYKQIGCGEKGEFIESIKTLGELKEKLREVATNGDAFFDKILKKQDINNPKSEDGLFEKIFKLDSFRGVYWSDKALNTISLKYFGDWMTLKELLYKEKVFKSDKGEIKVPQVIELSDLFGVLDSAESIVAFKEHFKDNNVEKQKIKEDQNLSNSQKLIKMIFVDIEANRKVFEDKKDKVRTMEKHKQDEDTQIVKDWLDSLLFTNQILKYFKVRENKIKGSPLNAEIYNQLEEILFQDNPTKEYDIVRNYLTQKPTEGINKLKLNFENASLAKGWSETKETEYRCLILQDNKQQKYLVVLRKENKDIFEVSNTELYMPDENGWRKMFFRQIGDIKRQLPRIMFSKTNFENVGGSEEIRKLKKESKWQVQEIKGDDLKKISLSIYNEKEYFINIKTDKNCSISSIKFVEKVSLAKLINWYKEALKKYPDWKDYDFTNFSPTETYKNIAEFYDEVEEKAQKLDFVSINKIKLDEYVESGKVYLFEIRNKDNNLKNKKEKEGTKNLYTMYWDEVFGKALNKPKLGANAEIFYRPELSEEKKEKLKAKDRKGKEIYKNFRFTKEKFIFHCPIILNFGAKEKDLSKELNVKMVQKQDDICLIGIDRGEKHLAYYSVINQKGEIIDQGSFNEINGQNYAEKLEKKAGDRDEARKNWKTIGAIKDLKDGYISQVVRKIVDLAVQHNAYIVLEKLDKGFKRGRQKIEKQVYQKLELALAKKLNFLVDKKAEIGAVGSVTKALQLTPPVANFQDIDGKSQFGIMLYVRANYTSQTDPVTGWRKSIYLKKGSEDNIKKQIANTFTDITFDGRDYCFAYKDQNGTPWKLYSGKNGVDLDRYYRERTGESIEGEMKVRWTPKKQEIKNTLDLLFENCDKKRSIFKQIIDEGVDLKKIDVKRTAWESLRFMIDVIQQIRNTGTEGKDDDFLISPVRDQDGNHFDSRKDDAIIPNGDANGAYNIARKGLMLFQKENGIKQKPEKPDLFIKDKQWDMWLANNIKK